MERLGFSLQLLIPESTLLAIYTHTRSSDMRSGLVGNYAVPNIHLADVFQIGFRLLRKRTKGVCRFVISKPAAFILNPIYGMILWGGERN